MSQLHAARPSHVICPVELVCYISSRSLILARTVSPTLETASNSSVFFTASCSKSSPSVPFVVSLAKNLSPSCHSYSVFENIHSFVGRSRLAVISPRPPQPRIGLVGVRLNSVRQIQYRQRGGLGLSAIDSDMSDSEYKKEVIMSGTSDGGAPSYGGESETMYPNGVFARVVDSFKRDPHQHATPKGVVGADGKVFDVETAAAATAESPLARKLKGRHLQMIAIGGSIGNVPNHTS